MFLPILMLTIVVQSAAAPSFDVATVKPSAPPEGPGPRYVGCHGSDSTPANATIPMGRCVAKGSPLRSVIGYAYNVPPTQLNDIISGPESLGDFYDIEAQAEKPVPVEQMKVMLQRLLAERFKLVLHREKKEI